MLQHKEQVIRYLNKEINAICVIILYIQNTLSEHYVSRLIHIGVIWI